MKQVKLGVAILIMLCCFDAAHACSCGKIGPPPEELKKHRAVFVGEVISVGPPKVIKLRNSKGRVYGVGPIIEVKFRVAKAWKGVNADTLIVKTNVPDGASCGWDFKEGRNYLVYAYGSLLRASHCSRTAPLESAGDDIRELDRVNPRTRK